ncbi:MAG: gamma-glutamylcyclotransferase [Actinobacteria bacterium]|nr:gamma-glutamylcyclotransferase [Actinomycetota bacterium]
MICDRCEKETQMFYTSWYNQQNICPACSEKEKKRNDYQACREAELEAVKRGDLNFVFKTPKEMK